MTTALLIVHGLLAVALLGAVTHQASAAVSRRAETRKSGFVTRFRTTDAIAYRNAVVALYCAVMLLGAILYPTYRTLVRPMLQDLDLRAANGVFELKEHFSALGLVVLPAYWVCWSPPLKPEYAIARVWLAWIMASIVWWNFLAGQVLVAIKGLFG
jgi:hypothetical protein